MTAYIQPVLGKGFSMIRTAVIITVTIAERNKYCTTTTTITNITNISNQTEDLTKFFCY